MRISRNKLTVLLNALYDRGNDTIGLSHPSTELDQLLSISLGSFDDCTIRFTKDRDAYTEAAQEIARSHPKIVADDIPRAGDYIKTVIATGILDLDNQDELATFVTRYGDPDLMAGHSPVVAGFDTNLLPWRIGRMLGLHDPDTGIGYVNGFVLATGVRDELDWDYKCHDTDPFVEVFGPAYEEYWNQPLGTNRIGRLGMLNYRTIRDIEQADEIQSESGDDAIIAAYDEYDRDHRCDVILFSNDRTFISRARSHQLLSHWVGFPRDLPKTATASWRELERLLYMLAVVFGVIELPGVTIHGVWRGKDELDWQYQRVRVEPRSPKLEATLETNLSIVETYDELTGSD